jgi:hypothetical protein
VLHHEGPITPDRTGMMNIICNVKKSMYGKGANSEASKIILIIYPV